LSYAFFLSSGVMAGQKPAVGRSSGKAVSKALQDKGYDQQNDHADVNDIISAAVLSTSAADGSCICLSVDNSWDFWENEAEKSVVVFLLTSAFLMRINQCPR
jgi:hypothetical protein